MESFVHNEWSLGPYVVVLLIGVAASAVARRWPRSIIASLPIVAFWGGNLCLEAFWAMSSATLGADLLDMTGSVLTFASALGLLTWGYLSGRRQAMRPAS